MGMARRTGSRSDRTGPAIDAAAERLFARRGYAAVTMRQIAAEVGVQVGALYLYTPDKQTLLFRLLRGHLEELLAAWNAYPGPDGRADQRLENFVRFHIGYHLSRPDAVFIANMELRNLEARNFRIIGGLRGAYEGVLRDILDDGVQDGTFRIEDTRLTTRAVIAMLTGVITWFRPDGPLNADEVAEAYLDMVKRTVGMT